MPLTDSELEHVAQQLRRPTGADGVAMARRLNDGNREIHLNTLKSLRLNPGDRLLEIGMANGFFVEDYLALAADLEYYGVDFSEIMVDEARAHNADRIESGRASFVFGDVFDLPFEENSFDAVVTVNTIYFWDQPEIALANIHRVLKPDGQFVVSIRPRRVMQHYPFVKFGFELFTAERLAGLVEGAGFTVTDVNDYDEPTRMIDGVEVAVASLVVRGVRT